MTTSEHATAFEAYARRSKFGPDYLTWPLEEIEAEGLNVNRELFLKRKAEKEAPKQWR
jgi:hypothetical protein